MKLAIKIGSAAVVLVAIGSGLAWRDWTQSPKYSIKQLASAVDHHDRYEFEKYVDIDAVLQGIVSDTSDTVLGAAFGGVVITQAKPKLLAMVEDGNLPANPQAQKVIGSLGKDASLPIIRDGRNAHFTVNVTTEGGAPFGLMIHMTQVSDGYWRIDRVMNAKELHEAEKAEELAKKRADVQASNDQIDKLHVLAKLHTCVSGGWEGKNRFQIKFQNTSDQAIQGWHGAITIPLIGFKKGIVSTDSIAAGASDNGIWDADVNQFMQETVNACKLGETDQFNVEITMVEFAGGKTLERADLPTSL